MCAMFFGREAELLRSTRVGRQRLLLYPALLSLGVGVLAACVGKEAPLQPQTAAVRPPPSPQVELTAHLPPVPRPVRKPTPPPGEGSNEPRLAMTAPNRSEGVTAQPSPLPPGSQPMPTSLGPTPSPSLQTSELIGLDQPAATRLFGTATERSEQPPATVWRYKNASCELDLFFYLDLSSGRMRTLHYSLKGDAGDATKQADCLKSLAAVQNN
jgi:hypothetical protein